MGLGGEPKCPKNIYQEFRLQSFDPEFFNQSLNFLERHNSNIKVNLQTQYVVSSTFDVDQGKWWRVQSEDVGDDLKDDEAHL